MTPPHDLARTFAAVPVNAHLGLELLSATGDTAVVRLTPADGHVQETGVIHGGLIATTADTAAVYALLPALPGGQTLTSIEFKLNFLRPATRAGGPLVATASVVRRGRKVGVCQVDVAQAGRSVATGLFTYLVFDAQEWGPDPGQRG